MTKLLASFSIIFCGYFFFDRKWTDVTQQRALGWNIRAVTLSDFNTWPNRFAIEMKKMLLPNPVF